ncbi:MAG: SDR family oxidoreductase [Alphaproteobacteria bacterium]|nr:SDR family oxidoreductase [Alphaproteobacteria bacterium]
MTQAPTIYSLFDIRGRVILMTGASSGIGRSLAKDLAALGARVACAARRADRLMALVDEIAAAGGAAAAFPCDITAAGAAATLVDAVERRLGPLDVLVNNAGVSLPAPLLNIERADWDMVIRTNLDSAWALAQEAAKRMATRGRGSIVNISSIASFRGFSVAPAYGAAKAALNNLTMTMGAELAPKGVRVNAIAPGSFDSELGGNYAARHPEYRARNIAKIPMQRVGDHRELLGPLVMLASEAASYMTGTVLVVDGGVTAAR